MTSTSETVKSSRAFSAKSGQSDAGSTTTASIWQPNNPPAAFCLSTSISMVSFNVVSEIAIVPESECSTPILIGSAHSAAASVVLPKSAAVIRKGSFSVIGHTILLSLRVY